MMKKISLILSLVLICSLFAEQSVSAKYLSEVSFKKYDNAYFFDDFSKYDGTNIGGDLQTNSIGYYAINAARYVYGEKDSNYAVMPKATYSTPSYDKNYTALALDGPRGGWFADPDAQPPIAASPNGFRFNIDKEHFEDAGVALVFSYDAYIPYDRKDNVMVESYIGISTDGGLTYDRWLARGGKLKSSSSGQNIIGYNASKTIDGTTSNALNNITSTGTPQIDLKLTQSELGRWVNMQTVLSYDAQSKSYISWNLVDGEPIKQTAGSDAGKIAKIIATPTDDYLNKIQNRECLSFFIGARYATEGKPVAVDNVAMYLFKSAEAQDGKIDGKTITIPFTNGYNYISSINPPNQVTKGWINTDTASNVKVYLDDKLVDGTTTVTDGNVLKILLSVEPSEGQRLKIVLEGVEDIAGNQVKPDNRAYSITKPVITSQSKVAPFSIFEKSEGVHYIVNIDSGTYTVKDYFGEIVKSSEFSNGKIDIANLNLGRFEITVNDGICETSGGFSVVPDVDTRRDSSESGFAFSAMASHTPTSQNYESVYAKTIKLAGVHYVREFCNADEVDKLTSEGSKRYRKLLNEYAANDIGVMFMFQVFPGKSNGIGKEDGHAVTRDMISVYNKVKSIFNQHGNLIDTIEILNEVDVNGATVYDGPDLYAAFLKTAAIAAADSKSDVLISTEGSAQNQFGYMEKLFSNQISDYFDVYNTHWYENEDAGCSSNVVEYPENIDEYFFQSRPYGLTEKKLWMGEFGLRMRYETGLDDLNIEQQKGQARTAPTALITAQANGADRIFWFIHGYISEAISGQNNANGYGTIDANYNPNMVYSSISALTNAIGNARYKGKFDNSNTEVNAHCYEDGNTEIGCFWSDNEQQIELSVNRGNVTLTDIMGNEKTISVNDGKVTLTVGPDIQYIRAENGFSSESVQKRVEYDKDYKRTKFTKSKKIVMLPIFENSASEWTRDRSYILSGTSGNTVKLRVYNFNDEEMSGNVRITPPEGWNVSITSKDVTVAPMDYAELDITLTGSNSAVKPIIFSAEFDGERVSDAVSYINSKNLGPYDAHRYISNIELNSISYTDDMLKTEFNMDIKAVKYLIDGRMYDVPVSGRIAELKIPLTNGEHTVYVSAFEESNTSVAFEKTILVERDSADCVITYNANGGGGAPMPQLAKNGEEFKLSSDRPYKRNSVFIGWSRSNNSDSVEYNPGDKISAELNMVLYAVWDDCVEINSEHFARYVADKATIKGKVDVLYAGTKAAFVVFNGAVSANNITASDIVHIGETVIDSEGEYVIEFNVSDFPDYRYILNTKEGVISSKLIEVSTVYDILDYEITVSQRNDTFSVKAVFEKLSEEESPVYLITALYDENESLIETYMVFAEVERGKSGIGGVYKIPENAVTRKIFLWTADGNLTPICEPKIYQ